MNPSSSLHLLERWLKQRAGDHRDDDEDDKEVEYDDVLMPCRDKVPSFPHARGAWTWSQYDDVSPCCNKKKDFQIGILCGRLCVIDVDDAETARGLEAAFPVLTTPSLPRAKTARGMHYYFRRSRTADRLGYWDGCSQVRPGVDFKTRCSTGTRGFVVVPPSAGKTWIVAPWEGELIDIPDDLLAAVAVSRPVPRPAVKATLSFADGSCVSVDDRADIANRCALFAPFLDASTSITLPVPDTVDVTAGDVASLLDLVRDGRRRRLTSEDLDDATRVARAADYLGLDMKLFRRVFDHHRPHNAWRVMRDLADLDPEWARRAFAPDATRKVVRDVIGPLPYRPIRDVRDDRWLLSDCVPRPVAPGEDLLTSDPDRVWSGLPDNLKIVLQNHPGRLVVAGGWPLGMATSHHVAEGRDLDLFVVGTATDRDADRIVEDVVTSFDDAESIAQSRCAVTISTADADLVQVVLKRYEDVESLLDDFDIDASRVALYWDDVRRRPRLVATDAWFVSVSRLAIFLRTQPWTRASASRVWKYYAKGFEVFLPGAERSLFRVDRNVRADTNKKNGPGVADVFAAEDDLVRRLLEPQRRGFADAFQPPASVPVARPCGTTVLEETARFFRGRGGASSAYEWDVDLRDVLSLWHALRHMMTWAYSMVFDASASPKPTSSHEMRRGLRMWTRDEICDPVRPDPVRWPWVQGAFSETRPALDRLYDGPAYEREWSSLDDRRRERRGARAEALHRGRERMRRSCGIGSSLWTSALAWLDPSAGPSKPWTCPYCSRTIPGRWHDRGGPHQHLCSAHAAQLQELKVV